MHGILFTAKGRLSGLPFVSFIKKQAAPDNQRADCHCARRHCFIKKYHPKSIAYEKNC